MTIDRIEEREGRRPHLRKIADRLNADAREYPADDASRSIDRPDSPHRANGPGGKPSGSVD